MYLSMTGLNYTQPFARYWVTEIGGFRCSAVSYSGSHWRTYGKRRRQRKQTNAGGTTYRWNVPA